MTLKIFENILNNPLQIEKYGNLNFDKILIKLSNCKPALKLLFIVGFVKERAANNNTRLIWNNTKGNIEILSRIYKYLCLDDDEIDSYLLLINEGYTNDQVLDAIHFSIDNK